MAFEARMTAGATKACEKVTFSKVVYVDPLNVGCGESRG
jgi:hypothetical protein